MRRLYFGHYMAALSFFLAFTSGAVYLYSRGVLVRDQIVDFDASRAQISLAFTTVHVANVVLAPLLGYLLDRYPIRNVVIAGAAWMGVGFFLMAQVQNVVQFAVVTALFVGFGTGALGTTANGKLIVNWFDRGRGLALGVAIMGYSVAGLVMSPIAVYLLESVGWRGAYVVFGSVCLLLVVPIVAVSLKQDPDRVEDGAAAADDEDPAIGRPALRRSDGSSSGAAPGNGTGCGASAWSSQLAVYFSFARSPGFWGAVLVFGLMSGVFGALNLHLFLHYGDVGVADYEAALILSWTAGVAVVSKLAFGRLIDRAGVRGATLVAVLGCAAAMITLASATAYAALLLAGTLAGFAFGGLVPLRAALISRLVAPARFSRAYGSLRLATFPVTILWTPLLGYIYDANGSYVPGFMLFALLFVCAAIAAYVLIPRALETSVADTPVAGASLTDGRPSAARRG